MSQSVHRVEVSSRGLSTTYGNGRCLHHMGIITNTMGSGNLNMKRYCGPCGTEGGLRRHWEFPVGGGGGTQEFQKEAPYDCKLP